MLIGEAARRSGVSARMLRHYDTLGLVRPTGRTVGGYREYSPQDIRRIFHVESLRSLGLSLRDIGRALDDPGFTPAALVADLIRRSEERLRREQELLERLRTVDSSGPDAWEDVRRIVELLHGLASPNPARRQQTALAAAEDTPATARMLAEALLAEPNTNVAGALRWALARTGGDGVAAVAAGLDSDDAEVRRRAVFTLAGTTGDDAAACLLRALDDPDGAVREHAALALGGRGEPAAVPVLIAMVVTGTKDVEAGEALGAVARKTDDTAIVGALVDTLAAHTADPAVRLRVAQALAEVPGAGAAGVLADLMRDPDRAVALTASAISRMRDRTARTSTKNADDRPAPGN
ncbi:HEAT repeat domain-containing protein [Cellulomonas cellasea]|uniref:HEAT repeat domain-containing protein n=1 Tax=Cellulomonas cellasea TaxID=43670 RepID=UPI0025A37A67|nr:HEAT repeat domain-containing protein [Cellulomonas cellasea]MDM8085114.1 HEAT repeat domain-containing protein [Cellulomonas cellasea]